MKSDPLLDAIFQPDEETLLPVLAAARRRRIRRTLAPVAAAVSCLAALWLLLPQAPQPVPRASAPPRKPIVETIQTRPLDPSEIVQTASSSITVVTTASAKAPTQIAEADLLALFGPGHVALVGSGSEQRLIEF
jgi:hypothetical protein